MHFNKLIQRKKQMLLERKEEVNKNMLSTMPSVSEKACQCSLIWYEWYKENSIDVFFFCLNISGKSPGEKWVKSGKVNNKIPLIEVKAPGFHREIPLDRVSHWVEWPWARAKDRGQRAGERVQSWVLRRMAYHFLWAVWHAWNFHSSQLSGYRKPGRIYTHPVDSSLEVQTNGSKKCSVVSATFFKGK